MIPEKNFTDDQRALYEAMSEISEDCYCAGWYIGNEFVLWDAMRDGMMEYGMGKIDPQQLAEVRRLSDKTGGWIIWIDDDYDASLPPEEWGPVFIPRCLWLAFVAISDQRAALRRRAGINTTTPA